jgi:regulator of protease activity HflC (stomatin/prohibitin superfamily)
MNPISIALSLLFGAAAAAAFAEGLRLPAAALLLIALIMLYALKMAKQWEKAVVLRAGKLDGVYGPGLFFIIPVIDNIAAWIDQRIQTTAVNAEQALTKDTVPVNVDAIIFWVVHDTQRAALEITDYKTAIQRVAQTSLREMIGASLLSELLSDRQAADARLKEEIGKKTAEWGITVNSVEIRDVAIPAALQDAMSRQAQAERERQARVILASSEEQIAKKFVNAAGTYEKDEIALNLRAMNILYESMKEKGAWVIVPTELADIIGATPQRVLAKKKKAMKDEETE